MKCAFCKLLLPTSPDKYGEVALIAPNGNGIVARLCSECLLAMGRMLDQLIKTGVDGMAEPDEKPLFVPPSIWRENAN